MVNHGLGAQKRGSFDGRKINNTEREEDSPKTAKRRKRTWCLFRRMQGEITRKELTDHQNGIYGQRHDPKGG